MVRLVLVRALCSPSLRALGKIAGVAHELGPVLSVVMFAFAEQFEVLLDQLVVDGCLAPVLRSQLVVLVVVLVVVLLLALANRVMPVALFFIPQSPSMVHEFFSVIWDTLRFVWIGFFQLALLDL